VQWVDLYAGWYKTIIDNWTKGNGGTAPNLLHAHSDTKFAWDTRDALLNSVSKGNQLIQPNIIGHAGQGHTANLVVALTVGVTPFLPMPDGGFDSQDGKFLAIDRPEIKTIIDWIEGGCLP
jgi:hypothetical protein